MIFLKRFSAAQWHQFVHSVNMGLTEYKRKRSFNATPEPQGGKATGKQLQFVIQKHDASRLHYDFRLELKGVLKSWAVPKGPSMNPADKRLAMLVEDHPFDYKNFEGIIPEGNYGAGTVIIWDQGTYEPIGEHSGTKAAQEKILSAAFQKGSMKIRMYGEKLKGEFAGVKRSFIPIQAIIRIDEVEKEGVASISKGDNIAAFPIQFAPRGNTSSQPD